MKKTAKHTALIFQIVASPFILFCVFALCMHQLGYEIVLWSTTILTNTIWVNFSAVLFIETLMVIVLACKIRKFTLFLLCLLLIPSLLFQTVIFLPLRLIFNTEPNTTSHQISGFDQAILIEHTLFFHTSHFTVYESKNGVLAKQITSFSSKAASPHVEVEINDQSICLLFGTGVDVTLIYQNGHFRQAP